MPTAFAAAASPAICVATAAGGGETCGLFGLGFPYSRHTSDVFAESVHVWFAICG